MDSHMVVLSLEQEQRTTFDDAVITKELGEVQVLFFKNQKYKDLLRPFQEFIFYKNLLLIAHGNILSIFDTEDSKWVCHHKFEELPGAEAYS